MDILTNPNIVELGALFVALLAIVLLIVVPLIRYSNKNSSQTVVILDKIISKSDERNRQQYEEMISRTKECQGEFVSALKTVEERHEHSMKAVANATAGKLDTIIETTTVLMQQNERLANDINQPCASIVVYCSHVAWIEGLRLKHK